MQTTLSTTTTTDITREERYTKCITIGNAVMLISLFIVSYSIFITFLCPEYHALTTQIIAHIATIIFAAFVKIGYVIRCIGLNGLGIKEI